MRHRPPAWYLVVLGCVAATRLAELGLSRRHLGASAEVVAEDDRFAPIVTLHIALFAAPLAESVAWRRRPRAVALWAALLAAATALRWWSILSLGRQWSVRVAVRPGFRPSEKGPYRWVRHPNYLALGVEFLALPALAGAWISAAVLSLLHGWVISGRIRTEERLLNAVPAYRQRFAGRARFLPGVF